MKNKSLASGPVFFFGISLTAGILIFYEMVAFQTLLFVSDYMRAIQILAIALLGISVGGVGAFIFRKWASRKFYWIVAALLPLTILVAFASLFLFPDDVWIYSTGLMLPFVAGSLILSMTFALAPSHRVYFFDLCGAAAGAVIACVSVPYLREEGSILLIVALGFVAAGIFVSLTGGRRARRGVLVFGLLTLLTLGTLSANLFGNFLNLVWLVQPSEIRGKIYNQWHKYSKAGSRPESLRSFELKYSRGSLVERIDMVKTRKNWIVTYFNGLSNDHVSRTRAKNYVKDRRLPHGLVKDPQVLVIGTAAEGITKAAKSLGKGKVYGVEINPAIVKLMTKELYRWSRKAYKDIDIQVIDARSFLKRTDLHFDIITMLNTHRMRNIGYVGQPEYLHTVEAMRDIFDRLSDRGWLVLEERDVNDTARMGILRFISTAKHVLENEFQVEDSSQHFWVYDWYGRKRRARRSLYTEILIKKTPINEEDQAFIEEWMAMEKARPINIATKSPILRYKPGWSDNHRTNRLIRASDPYLVIDKSKYNMDPVTDDKPFPFDVLRDRPYMKNIMPSMVKLTLVLGLLPVLLLLFRHVFQPGARSRGRVSTLGYGAVAIAYFSLLGIGYLGIEVVLIQRLQIFLGMPVLTLAVVIGGMLFFSGLGSLISHAWPLKKQLKVFLLVPVFCPALFFVLEPLVNLMIGFPLFVRVAVTLFFLAPLAFGMGIPFPFGLVLVKKRLSEGFGAAMFGLNGAFSALATPLALSLAMTHGFQFTYLAACAVYALCLLLAVPLVLPQVIGARN